MITKICGIKNEDTLICCEDNNVDFFGMIFYPKSPRNISIEDANNLQKKSENLKTYQRLIMKVTTKNERLIKEMISKNRRYGSSDDIVNEAIESFYQSEKKRGFR